MNRYAESERGESSAEGSIKGCFAEGSSSCSLSFEMLQSLKQRSHCQLLTAGLMQSALGDTYTRWKKLVGIFFCKYIFMYRKSSMVF